MKQKQENKDLITAYLFGDMKSGERDEIEEKLFLDEEFALFADGVENDLVDEYIRGELSPAARAKFESRYLTTESRRKKVETARTLRDELFDKETKDLVAAPANKTGKVSFWQSLENIFRLPNLAWTGSLAIIFLATLVSIWLLNSPPVDEDLVRVDEANESNWQYPQNAAVVSEDPVEKEPKTEIRANAKPADPVPADPGKKPPAKRETPAARSSKPAAAPPGERKDRAAPRQAKVFAFSLMPPLRSSQKPVLKIPAETRTIRLRLFDDFSKKYEKFFVEINDETGNAVWNGEIVPSGKSAPKSLSVNVARERLESGDYELALRGMTPEGNVEEINFYNFRIEANAGTRKNRGKGEN